MSRFLSAAATAALLGAMLVAVSAPSAQGDEHCVARVMSVDADGELQLSDPICRRGGAAVRDELVAAAIGEIDAELAASGLGVSIRMSGSVLGVHYDGVYSGASLTITGAGCTGGWVNLSSYWDNRVSSTINGICTRVKHHDYSNKGGSFQSTWGWGGALSYMNNRANSISYEMA